MPKRQVDINAMVGKKVMERIAALVATTSDVCGLQSLCRTVTDQLIDEFHIPTVDGATQLRWTVSNYIATQRHPSEQASTAMSTAVPIDTIVVEIDVDNLMPLDLTVRQPTPTQATSFNPHDYAEWDNALQHKIMDIRHQEVVFQIKKLENQPLEKLRLITEQQRIKTEFEKQKIKVDLEQRKIDMEMEQRKTDREQEQRKIDREMEQRKTEREQEQRKIDMEMEQQRRKMDMEMEQHKMDVALEQRKLDLEQRRLDMEANRSETQQLQARAKLERSVHTKKRGEKRSAPDVDDWLEAQGRRGWCNMRCLSSHVWSTRPAGCTDTISDVFRRVSAHPLPPGTRSRARMCPEMANMPLASLTYVDVTADVEAIAHSFWTTDGDVVQPTSVVAEAAAAEEHTARATSTAVEPHAPPSPDLYRLASGAFDFAAAVVDPLALNETDRVTAIKTLDMRFVRTRDIAETWRVLWPKRPQNPLVIPTWLDVASDPIVPLVRAWIASGNAETVPHPHIQYQIPTTRVPCRRCR